MRQAELDFIEGQWEALGKKSGELLFPFFGKDFIKKQLGRFEEVLEERSKGFAQAVKVMNGLEPNSIY